MCCCGVKYRRRAGSKFPQQRRSDQLSLCQSFVLFTVAPVGPTKKTTRSLSNAQDCGSQRGKNSKRKNGSPSFVFGQEEWSRMMSLSTWVLKHIKFKKNLWECYNMNSTKKKLCICKILHPYSIVLSFVALFT